MDAVVVACIVQKFELDDLKDPFPHLTFYDSLSCVACGTAKFPLSSIANV